MAKINISIPQPCHENWDAMSPESKGRFCDSCQKKVFDFTTSSDREIVTAFQQNNNLCGRFLDTQLNRDLIKPEKKNPIWLATTSAIVSLVGLNEVAAQQTSPKTIQTDRRVVVGKPAAPIKLGETTANPEIIVKGQLFGDESEKLADVLIQVKNKDNVIYSDANGFFSAKIMKGDILIFSKKGYEPEQIRFNESKGNFQLNLYAITFQRHIMGKMISRTETVTQTVTTTKKRTFFGRIFYHIGNLFR